MPRCEGRPGEPCPDNKNDRSVHLSQGDLMLCDACEQVRFPSTVASKRSKSSRGKKENDADRFQTSFAASNPTAGVVQAAADATITVTLPSFVVNELLA